MASVTDDGAAARQRHAQLSVEITEHQHRYYDPAPLEVGLYSLAF